VRIKLVVATVDSLYRNRIGSLLQERYRGKFTLAMLSNIEDAIQKANEIKADVLLADEDMEVAEADLPKHCRHIVLIEKMGIRSIGGRTAVCKYQSIQDFYSDIVEVFSNQTDEADIQIDSESQKKTIITFTSSSGGVGVSTLAAAYALHLVQEGTSALYLNLEEFGSSELYFNGSGKQDYSNVIYALELDNSSTFLRIENALRRTTSGVFYIAPSKAALDMKDLNEERVDLLFENLKKSKLFDTIVVDMPFRFDDKTISQIRRSDTAVFISDGSLTANYKLKRVSDTLEILSKSDEKLMDCRSYLFYNRFSSKNGKKIENTIFSEAGGLGRIENANPVDLISLISSNKIFEKL